jgi:hypothetical protein
MSVNSPDRRRAPFLPLAQFPMAASCFWMAFDRNNYRALLLASSLATFKWHSSGHSRDQRLGLRRAGSS